MLTNTISLIKGVLSITYIIVVLTFGVGPLLVLAVLKLIMPMDRLKEIPYQGMIKIYSLAVWANRILFTHLLGIHFQHSPISGVERDKNYLVISNHQSWADILVLQSLLNPRTPILKFIVKKELLFMPLVGLICLAYEYPFVSRKSLRSNQNVSESPLRDLIAIKRKLKHLEQHPTTVINFVEGTRFNPLKSKKAHSPHQHLLPPRAGGLTYLLKTLGSQFHQLLDITIVYHTTSPVFWRFLSGRCHRVTIDIRTIPIKDLLETITGHSNSLNYKSVSVWLKGFWEEKDRKIERMKHPPNN